MGRGTPYQKKWALKFGIAISELDPITSQVTSCICLFCKFLGRSTVVSAVRKRKSTGNVQFWNYPFRSENIETHMQTQHVEDYHDFLQMSSDEKTAFWASKTSRLQTLHSHWDLSSDTVTFNISASVINDIIGELMFNEEDDLAAADQEEDDNVDDAVAQAKKLAARAAISKRRAMELFVEQEDGSYVAKIKTPLKFELSIGFVSAGMSFRQTAEAVGMTHRLCKIAKLAGLNDTIVGQWVRILVGGCLQQIANLLADDDLWAFALAFDGSTHRGTTFFDVRIRFGFHGVLYNMHVIALPQFDRHTAANIVNLLVKLMNALYPRWRKKIIGVASDGEPAMTGRIQGVVTKIVEQGEFDVIRVWCIPHQMDLVVRATTEAIDQGEWIDVVYKLSVYLRAQSNLILSMGVTCPKKTNRWLHLGMVVDFLLKYNARITSYIADRPANAARPPVLTSTFWVITAAVAPAIARMNRTFVELQDRSLIISQQRGFLESMMADLVVLFSIKHARTDAAGMAELRVDQLYKEDEWWVEYSSMIEFIEDLGMHANDNWDTLDDEDDDTSGTKAHVLRVLCEYAVKTIIALEKMQAERDQNNHAAVLEAPACMPADLARMRPKLFRDDILTPRLAHVQLFFKPDEIASIDQDHRDLVKAYKDEPGVKAVLDSHSHNTKFNDGWNSIGVARFSQLRRFCSGLAAVFANTTSVESDFSILKWEKDEFRMNLLDLLLEGIFQAKQFELLGQLRPNPVPHADDDDA